MEEYTKGKWEAIKQQQNNPDSWEFDVVCQREAGMYPSTIARDMNASNAHLIAAAPELYEACQAAFIWYYQGGEGDYTIIGDHLKQALAKAEGK